MLTIRKHTGLQNLKHWGFTLTANRKLWFFRRFDFNIEKLPYRQPFQCRTQKWSAQTRLSFLNFVVFIRWF